MITNDERREVARRLREYSGGRKAFHLGRLCAACGIDKSRLMSRTTDADAEAWAHLADLIEPSGHECVPGECPLNVRHDNDPADKAPAISTTEETVCNNELCPEHGRRRRTATSARRPTSTSGDGSMKCRT